MQNHLSLAFCLTLFSLAPACAVEGDDDGAVLDPGASDGLDAIRADEVDAIDRVTTTPADDATEVVRPTDDRGGPGVSDVFLAPDGDDAAECSERRPCRSFARANERLSRRGGRIELAPGTYVDNIVLDRPATIAGNGSWLVANPNLGGVPVVEPGDGEIVIENLIVYVTQREPIRCGAGGGVALDGVRTNAPILCDAAGAVNRVRLERAWTSGAILVNRGAITIQRSRIVASDGVWLTHTSYEITNSLFARNAGGITFTGRLHDGAPHRFEHNTVIDSGTPNATTGTIGVECRDHAPSDFAHNLVWTTFQPNFGVVVSRGCTHSPDSWIWSYASPNPDPLLTPDYHLREGSPLIDAAEEVHAGDFDLDGDVREPGTRADVGADERVP